MPEGATFDPKLTRKGLISRAKPDWEARLQASSIVSRVINLVLDMHRQNMKIGYGHGYASKWYQWPLATGRWVLYWTMEGKHILCMANVLLWWPVFAGIVINFGRIVMTWDMGSETSSMVVGYLLSYLPFAFIPRDIFIYHYAVPLIFGCCNLGVLLERSVAPEIRGFCYFGVSMMAVVGFFLWCPWAYGLTTPEFDFLVWNNAWR
jgi:dolichyl-phosphate-mannose--protein O-mannosyl transferase